MELALRRCTFETCADSIDPYGYAPLSAPPARQAAQPCEPAMVSKAEHIVVLPHKCPAVPDHPSDTLLHMPRHHVTVPAKLAQMQSHQIRHRANDVGQIFLQPPHMHLMALGAAVQLRGLHAHIVKSSMHTHTRVDASATCSDRRSASRSRSRGRFGFWMHRGRHGLQKQILARGLEPKSSDPFLTCF